MAEQLARPPHHPLSARSPAPARPDSASRTSPIDKATEYAAEDADVTLRLWRVLKPRLAAEHMITRLRDPGAPADTGAGAHGAARHRDRPRDARRGSPAISPRAPRARGGDPALAGEPLNPGSPKQLGDILFGKMGLPRRQEDQDRRMVDHRRACSKISPSKAMRCRRNPRMAPGRQAALDLYRRAAGLRQSAAPAASTPATRSPRPPPGGCPRPSPICRTSRCAPRKAARSAAPSSPRPATSWSRPTIPRSSCACWREIADIPALKEAFRDGLDIHAMTASEMFGVPVAGMPGEVRRRAKAINFGIIYGISAFGLANQLGIPRERGRRLHQEIFRALPRHPRLYGRDQEFCRRTAMSTTIFGRKCHYPDIKRRIPLDPRLQRARRHQCADSRAAPPTSSAAP